MIWCPYTNTELPETALNREHIIPLSLGGADNFVIQAEAKANSRLGTQIDGPLANDPLIMFARRGFDARGHSDAPVIVRAKRATFQGRPVQVTFLGPDAPPEIWDAKSRRVLEKDEVGNEPFKIQWQISVFGRLRFIAKVALSAGWHCLGSYFRDCVAHDELRVIMNASSIKEVRLISPRIRTRIDGALLLEPDTSFPAAHVINYACDSIMGSAVFITALESSICFSVGILGRYIGALNVPAKTEKFPSSDEFDLGHCVVITQGAARRLSFRQFSSDLMELIESWEIRKQPEGDDQNADV